MNNEWLYPTSAKHAIEIQKIMAQKLILEDSNILPKWIAGMDVSCNLFDPNKEIFASCVLLNNDLQVHETQSVKEKQLFPYIPGLLAFREAPALIHAYQALIQKPDLIMVDGHGISHPRQFGLACHIGTLLDIPTIGVAKSILVGQSVRKLRSKVGSTVELTHKGQIIAKLVRTKKGCKPIIVSVGYKISLDRAVELVLQNIRGYRLPEATRLTHLVANKFRKFLIK